jgi:hypothetical protein
VANKTGIGAMNEGGIGVMRSIGIAGGMAARAGMIEATRQTSATVFAQRCDRRISFPRYPSILTFVSLFL